MPIYVYMHICGYIYIYIYIYRFTYKCIFHISFFILTNILVVLHNCRRLCKTTEIFLRIKIVFYLIWFLASDLFIYNMYYIYIYKIHIIYKYIYIYIYLYIILYPVAISGSRNTLPII